MQTRKNEDKAYSSKTRVNLHGKKDDFVKQEMGHANIAVTMEVYNHITGTERIEKKIRKLDELMVV